MKEEYRILIAGDLLPSPSNKKLFAQGDVKQLYGEKILQLFAEADFSILNLEGAITDRAERIEKNGPRLKTQTDKIEGIKQLGVTAISLANNHSMDLGHQGYIDTINTLDSAGIAHVGAGLNQNCIEKYLSINLGPKKVCIYSVSETFFNIPTETEAGANIYDEYVVCNEIKELKNNHDFVIVLYHGGAEYFQYPTSLVRKRCHRMSDCGADCIITQHSHCIGCEEYYNNSYILYGQGNFLFARQKSYPLLTKEGLLIEIIFKGNDVSINRHHLDIIDNVIRYSEVQDLSELEERSRNIDNQEFIDKNYQSLKVGEIMDYYLLAFKGTFPLRDLLLKYCPRLLKKLVRKSYSRKQIFQIYNLLTSERGSEDMRQVLRYMLDNTKE